MRLKLLGFLLTVLLTLAACGGEQAAPTATPTNIPTTTSPPPTETPRPTRVIVPTVTFPPDPVEITPEVTEEPEIIYAMSDLNEALDPPIQLTLPQGWGSANGTQLIQDIDGPRILPFTVYEGPVTGGTAQIILVWGFPQIGLGGNPFDPATKTVFSLYTDGLRILRLAVVDSDCNVGTDVERTYSIGGELAKGTVFSAVSCAASEDTRGWFAGIRKDELNFVFYMTGTPITVMDGDAPLEIQAILDTVTFHVDELRQRPTSAP